MGAYGSWRRREIEDYAGIAGMLELDSKAVCCLALLWDVIGPKEPTTPPHLETSHQLLDLETPLPYTSRSIDETQCPEPLTTVSRRL